MARFYCYVTSAFVSCFPACGAIVRQTTQSVAVRACTNVRVHKINACIVTAGKDLLTLVCHTVTECWSVSSSVVWETASAP